MDIDKLMAFDPLAEAEKLTGTSIHDPGSAASELGMFLSIRHNDVKEAALRISGDTYWGMSWEEFCSLIEGHDLIQFTRIYEHNWKDPKWDSMERTGAVWVNAEHGFLLSADNFSWGDRKPMINAGNVYFASRRSEHPMGGFSGGFEVYCKRESMGDCYGSYDVREGMYNHLIRLTMTGTAIKPWKYHNSLVWCYAHPRTEDEEDTNHQLHRDNFDVVFAECDPEVRAIFEQHFKQTEPFLLHPRPTKQDEEK